MRFPGENPLRAKPVIRHQRVTSARAGQDIRITAQVESREPIRDVSLRYRAMDQTQEWKRVSMEPSGEQAYSAAIPGDEIAAQFDMLYYLEARVAHGGALWPDWQHEAPYIVVHVEG